MIESESNWEIKKSKERKVRGERNRVRGKVEEEEEEKENKKEKRKEEKWRI